ncbi:hypothetical protein [Thermosipho atlanticus]|uniref:Multicomponent Na+:H+ antiporter subunit E n=1 Tax=Thermosipho atlanticus DSM 15807 TaxID=1123380 RepID=A0A1M5SQ32_9BACT|nr:hypothetical protein [Thermosipho atlanticus]SHH40595.1 multicomponent Na+:H+ antiporter subunit E [Thermosipho atlanticus DSM 15807]
MINEIINLLLGSLFLSTLLGYDKFLLSLLISFLTWIVIFPGKYNFLLLILEILKNIPKVIIEAVAILFLKNEKISMEKYKDDFEMLRKIIVITLTPKTIVFEHDEDYIYIHKIDKG